jgi:hypothetical protein
MYSDHEETPISRTLEESPNFMFICDQTILPHLYNIACVIYRASKISQFVEPKIQEEMHVHVKIHKNLGSWSLHLAIQTECTSPP